jgi:hypothetical protein
MTTTFPRLRPPPAIGFNPQDAELPLVVEVHAGDAIDAVGGFLASRARAQLVRLCAGGCPGWLDLPAGAEAEAMLRLRLDDTAVYPLDHRCDAVNAGRLVEELTNLLSAGRWCLTAYAGVPPIEAAVATACRQAGAHLVGYVPVPRPTGLAVDWAYHYQLPGGLRRAKAAARHALHGHEVLAYEDELFVHYR